MEGQGQPAKRRRVYSPEPNKVAQAMFASKYVNYLVPALIKIIKERSASHDSHSDMKNMIKYQVGMAMAVSAQGFAWSNALMGKLQRDHIVSRKTDAAVENEACEDSPRHFGQNGMVTLDFSSNPNLRGADGLPDIINKNLPADGNIEEENYGRGLERIRRLIPGGEEMCEEQMFAEFASYITCLEMQVKILHCLADQIIS